MASIPIETIKSQSKDFARPNRYWVQIATPGVMLGDRSSSWMKQIELNCNSAQFPSMSLGTSEQRMKGPLRKMPYDTIFAELSLTFYNSVEFRERNFFERWIHRIADPITKNFEYYDNYTTYILIAQLDQKGQVVHSVRLNEAYPIGVGEITLGYENGDQVEIFPIRISYRDWEQVDTVNVSSIFGDIF